MDESVRIHVNMSSVPLIDMNIDHELADRFSPVVGTLSDSMVV